MSTSETSRQKSATERKKDAIKVVLEEIDAGRIVLHRNAADRVSIRFAMSGCRRGIFTLHGADAAEILTALVYERAGDILHAKEVKDLVRLLAGKDLSRSRDVDDEALLTLLQTEPIVAVVNEFMYGRDQRRYEAKANEVFNSLRAFAENHDLTRLGGKRFPGASQVMTRELRKWKDVFETLGIHVQDRRSNGCWLVLERVADDSEVEASASSSAQNTSAGKEIGLDGRSRVELLARLKRIKEVKTSNQGENQCLHQ